MKKTALLLIIPAFLCMSFAYALIDSETRNLGDFDEVKVSSGIKLMLVPGNANKALIEVDEVELEDVITKIDGHKLVIKMANKKWSWKWKSSRKVEVTLTYKELEAVSASSGSSVKSDHTLSNDELEFDASSGASIHLEISGKDVEADASSGANIKLSRTADSFDVGVSSGSSIKASDLEAVSVTARGSSGGSIRVWAKEDLKAKVSSGASVRYKGNPKDIDKDKSSGGSVSKL